MLLQLQGQTSSWDPIVNPYHILGLCFWELCHHQLRAKADAVYSHGTTSVTTKQVHIPHTGSSCHILVLVLKTVGNFVTVKTSELKLMLFTAMAPYLSLLNKFIFLIQVQVQ